jgi:ribosomal-protein-alanine N-acetyltransferase
MGAPETLEIEARGERDLAELFAVARSVFADNRGWIDERVFGVMVVDTVFVARERGSLAGYVALHRDADDAICVDQLLVAPGHQKRGVGKRLLAHAEGYAISQGARTLRIVVEEENRPARAFYQRVGFVPVAHELVELALPVLP